MDTKTNNEYLKEISGLTGSVTNNDCLAEMSGLPGKETNQIHICTLAGLDPNTHTFNQCLKEYVGADFEGTNNDYLEYYLSIPLPDNVLQWLDGTKEGLGYYDGDSFNTVEVEQTLTSEWQCFFETDNYIPASPDDTETIYRFNSSGFGLAITSGYEVRVSGGGVPFTTFGSLNKDKLNEIKIECVLAGVISVTDALRVTINGTVYLFENFTYTLISTAAYCVCSRFGTEVSTCFMASWKDCVKEYFADQDHPEVTLTDPNGTFNKYQYLPDRSTIGTNYGLYNTVNETYNIDPTGAIETALGLPPGTLNAWLTRAQLDALHDAIIKFLSPIPENSTLPADKFRSVIYELLTILTQDQKDKLIRYVGRSL